MLSSVGGLCQTCRGYGRPGRCSARKPSHRVVWLVLFFFFQAEDGIRDLTVTGVQTCALPIFRAVERCVELRALPSNPGALEVALELWAAAHGVASLLIGIKGFPWPDDFADRKSVV